MNYWVFRIASALIGPLPEPAVRWLGCFLGRIAWRRADQRKQNATRAMARVLGADPDDPPLEASTLAQSAFESYGRYWAESFWIRPRRVDAIYSRIEVVGRSNLTDAFAAGGGVVLALPHIGNWEVAGTICVAEGAELLAVAERLGDDRIVDWFVRLRKLLGIDVVLATRADAVLETCQAAIGRNAAVALLADRNLSGRGVKLAFFGEETRLPVGPARLAIATGAPIVPAACYFKDGAGHRLVLGAPLPRHSADDVDSLTEKVARALEDLIKTDPSQWHMVQPNWPSDRKQPRRDTA